MKTHLYGSLMKLIQMFCAIFLFQFFSFSSQAYQGIVIFPDDSYQSVTIADRHEFISEFFEVSAPRSDYDFEVIYSGFSYLISEAGAPKMEALLQKYPDKGPDIFDLYNHFAGLFLSESAEEPYGPVVFLRANADISFEEVLEAINREGKKARSSPVSLLKQNKLYRISCMSTQGLCTIQ